ncbi:L-asparaginase [Citrobacter gillenii]|nr:L-asparaginase [Citrobacter gillenii]
MLRAYSIRTILLAISNLGSAQNPHVLRVRSGSSALESVKSARVIWN